MNTYEKKATAGELEIYQEVLNPFSEKYNQTFSVLILPKALSIDAERNILVLPFYEGETFNERWNESTGGALLDMELSSEIPHVLGDLALIDTTAIIENERLKNMPGIAFNNDIYFSKIETRMKRFLDTNLLTHAEAQKAIAILKEEFASPLILNNGDFYPRNFIRTPERKIVLIDWEPWNQHSPFYLLDHLENIAAVCFVHMWNNRAWQEAYVRGLRSLAMQKRNFQRAILIKSLELAEFWFKGDGRNKLCENQMTLFRQALTDEYMNGLWNAE